MNWKEPTLTSNLDFSLTKKRLQVMGKTSSLVLASSKKGVTILLISALTFIFCTKISGEKLPILPASDPQLYFEIDSTRFPIDLRSEEQKRRDRMGYNPNIPLMYEKEGGELYTGTHTSYYLNTSNEIIKIANSYKEGEPVSLQRFDMNGNEVYSTEIIYEDGIRKNETHHKYGILYFESIEPAFSESGYKENLEFYPNGQLKFESMINEYGYQGLMTLYDEDGAILKQELFKDGELLEVVK